MTDWIAAISSAEMWKRTMTQNPQNPEFGEARHGSGSQSAGDVENAGAAATAGRRRETHSQQKQDWRLDRSLFVVVCILLGVLMLLLCMSLYGQYANYRDAIAHGLESGAPIDHASVISYSRALDFAVSKTTALFSAFALVFVGALYVLRLGEAHYRLTAGTNGGRGSLQTSSPGLVMVTLGVILIALVLNAKSMVEYSHVPRESPQAAVHDSPSSSGNEQRLNEREQRLAKPPLSSIPPHSSPDPTERK